MNTISRLIFFKMALFFWLFIFYNKSANCQILGEEFLVKASYYHDNFHGKATSNNEKYNKNKNTAAHKKLPFNTLVEIENPKNNKILVVRINDRGPYTKGVNIDLSKAAAKYLGIMKKGKAMVKMRIVGLDSVLYLGPLFSKPDSLPK